MPWDAVWEQVFRDKEWGRYPAEDLIRFVARRFYAAPDRAQVKLLEIGCGPGSNLWYMAREGFSTHGIDGSPTAVDKARQRLDREVPGWKGEVVQGDMTSLPFPAGAFDAVIDSEAVCCNSYDDARRIYAEAARVAKPGGWLFSRTFARGCWGDQTGEKLGHNAWRVAEGPMSGLGYTRFTEREEIAEMIGGFAIEEVEWIAHSMDNGNKSIKEWIIIGRKNS